MFKRFTYILPLILFLCVYFIYIALTYRSYGVTWDETDVYSSGKITWQHLAVRSAPDEMPLMTKTPGAEIRAVYNSAYASVMYRLNLGESYERYHALNMLFHSLAFIAAYVLLLKYYKDPWLALVGPIFLVALPRYFGDFPANPKDVPFATMYLFALTLIYYVVEYRNVYVRIILFGLAFGFLQSLRIVGVTILGVLFAYEIYLYLRKHVDILEIMHAIRWLSQTVMRIVIIATVAMFITTISWPYLGSSFLKHLLDILKTSREYPWLGGTLTHGKLLYSYALPWYYLPTWFLVTTPVFVIVLSIVGVIRGLMTNFKNPLYFILITGLTLNFSLYYLSHPNMYDGMRHFMYVLPMMGMLAAVVFIEILLYGRPFFKNIVVIGVVVNIILIGGAYVRLYPYQYLYFNEFVGGLTGASGRYETDYWGASFRESVLWLKDYAREDTRPVKIFTCANPFISTYYFSDWMQWVDKSEIADYSICYTRSNEHKDLNGRVIHIVKREGVGLNYITKNAR